MTYNHEAFIEQAIVEALNQDVTFDYEVIVGEDCSTDATAEILKRLETLNSPRLKVIYRDKNIGARANFLDTIARCQGEFIAFLEGDDFWTSREKLRRQVDFLDRHKDVPFCFHRTRTLTAIVEAEEYILPAVDPPNLSSFGHFIQDSCRVATSSIVARRTCLADIATWLGQIEPGDWPLCLMLAKQGQVGFLPIEMSRYRVHAGGNWTRMAPHLRVVTVIRMFLQIAKLLDGEDKKLVERRQAEMAEWWAGELICNESLSLDELLGDLDSICDYQLTRYLLKLTVEKARTIQQARVWFEQQLIVSEEKVKKIPER